MLRKKILQAGLLPLLALPLMGESCTSEKLVALSVGFDTTAEFIAEGSLNVHDDTDTFDVKEDLDVESVLDDAGVDAEDILSIKVSRIYYRVTVADDEPTRMIENGNVTIQRGSATPIDVISNFSGAAGAVTDWIEVTSDVNEDAVTMLNVFMEEYLGELQGGPPVTDSQFTYHVTGTSNPQGVPSFFQWELKITFNAKVEESFDVLDF
jgi:hypothetical protein